jgi:glutamine synthetase
MFSSPDEVLSFIKNENVEFIDVRFTDLPGQQQHFNVPAATLPEDFFVEGVMFDGSSIRGFAQIHKSDMKLVPDVSTAYVDPFRAAKTLNLNFSIVEPRTGEPYERDPRQVATKAEAYLASTGIADTVYIGPEAEFYVFDDVRFQTRQNEGFDRGRLEHRPGGRGRQPRLQDPLQGRLLPRPAGGPLRRPARPDDVRAGRVGTGDRARAPRGGHRRSG